MAQGELVPDDVVDAMIEERIRKAPADKGFLFDGFPRTSYQAKFLDELFQELDRNLAAVIYLRVPDEEIVARLQGRLICKVCNAPFHKEHFPFKSCPAHKCGGDHLFQRPDDTPEMVRARLKAFHRTTAPVLDYYQETGRLLVVNGHDTADRVAQALTEAVAAAHRRELKFSTAEEVAQLKSSQDSSILLPGWGPLHPSLNLVLVGAPGSGKGTQAEYLTRELRLQHIATGDLFRENLKNQTELGKLAKSYMERGELVPDNVTEAMVQERLSRPDTEAGFILDGFPRTLPQAGALLDIMGAMARKLSGVLYINVSDEEIVRRLSGRLICRNCQAPYHLSFKPARQENVCDLCGGPLYQREDDNPKTVRNRLKTFHAQTEPMIEFFAKAGLLTEIAGEGDIRSISRRALAAALNIDESSRRLEEPISA
jgi:adenylate kinase